MRDIQKIILHRISVEHAGYPNTPQGIRDFFAFSPEGMKATGGYFPYHFVVDRQAEIHSMVDVQIPTPHAYMINRIAIGIAVIGDFRIEPIPYECMLSCAAIIANIWQTYPKATVHGHTEIGKTSRHKGKKCPGQYFDSQIAVNCAHMMYEHFRVWKGIGEGTIASNQTLPNACIEIEKNLTKQRMDLAHDDHARFATEESIPEQVSKGAEK